MSLRNKISVLVVLSMSISYLFSLVNVVEAAPVNLIPNPSLETVSASSTTTPDQWSNGSWGTNTVNYTYPSNGQNGTRSVRVNMTSYTDGDAKWFFNPVNIQPSTVYYFSDFYKSNVETDLVAEIQDSTGNVSYQYLDTLISSTAWKQYSTTFTTPANAAKITILHIIYSVGYLQTDNFVLRLPQTAVVTNGVPNNSVEVASDTNSTIPDGWYKGSWGTNTASFTWTKTGYNGTSRAVRIDMSGYIDGDAKWFFEPQPVVAGKEYVFTDYFKSNVTTQLVAQITNADNSTSYVTLQTISANTAWTRAKVVFTIPQNAVKATMYHVIQGNGYLVTDEFSFVPFLGVGFSRPIVSINFDDGWKSVRTNALDKLNSYGLKSTQYLVSSFLDTPEYMTTAEAKDFQNSGHEIGSHSVDHKDLTTLTAQQITAELNQSKKTLESKFGTGVIKDYAAPYGTYNDAIIKQAKKYYQSYRTTDAGFLYKNDTDVYKIKTQNVDLNTTLADVQNWVNSAIANKTWLVLVYHQVDNAGGQYSTTPANLDAQLSFIKNSGVQVSTMNEAINEILPQL